jgi:hypothetical protein
MNTTVHTVTAEDFEVRNGDLYYTGPLAEAQAFIRQEYGVTEHVITLNGDLGQAHEVLIAYSHDAPTMADAAEWGHGPTLEDAWRWVLAAAFGPLDDEFVPFPLTIRES